MPATVYHPAVVPAPATRIPASVRAAYPDTCALWELNNLPADALYRILSGETR